MPTRALVAAAVFLLHLGCATARTAPNPTAGVTVADASCLPLEPLVRRWQAALGYRDWTIVLHCMTRADVPDRAMGQSFVAAEDRAAAIWIRPDATDPELAVIHEFLHLVLSQSCTGGETLREQQLRALARVLRR